MARTWEERWLENSKERQRLLEERLEEGRRMGIHYCPICKLTPIPAKDSLIPCAACLKIYPWAKKRPV